MIFHYHLNSHCPYLLSIKPITIGTRAWLKSLSVGLFTFLRILHLHSLQQLNPSLVQRVLHRLAKSANSVMHHQLFHQKENLIHRGFVRIITHKKTKLSRHSILTIGSQDILPCPGHLITKSSKMQKKRKMPDYSGSSSGIPTYADSPIMHVMTRHNCF